MDTPASHAISAEPRTGTAHEPFITAYGDYPLVVMTEPDGKGMACTASIVRPRRVFLHGSGRTWPDAHWDLFNSLLSEYAFLDRNRGQLRPERLVLLGELDAMREDGTLALIAAIARRGFPPGMRRETNSEAAQEA